MLTIVLAAAGALVYGAADFVGGVASKRVSAVRVATVSAGVGVVVFALLVLIWPQIWSVNAVLWGALSGVAGIAAVALLYACLAIGPMAILSPLTAVISGAFPVVWTLWNGEPLGTTTLVAIVIVLVGAALIGFSPLAPRSRPRPLGLGLAVAAGVLFGTFYVILSNAPADSGAVPLLANRIVSLILMLTVGVVITFTRRRRGAPTSTHSPYMALAVVTGILDSSANALLLLALRSDELATVSVITSLYPVGTIALAAILLKENIAPSQWAGIVIAMIGSVLISVK